MTTQRWFENKRHVLAAAALGLFSQAALSGEANAARNEPEELRVSAPRLETAIADSTIETDAEAVIDAMNRRVAKDLEKRIETIRGPRIDLAVSELRTRG